MENLMKWDMVDDTFPKRFYISECLSNGYLPLWCPYQNMGLPIHADPSSYTWYPVTWIISLLHGYDFYAINFEFLFHIFFAGLGMYTLAHQLKLSKGVGVFMALSYSFSGYSVGNAEHAMFIIAAAWLPFVLSSFLEMLETQNNRAAIKTGFFLYLVFTGGYITFTIVLVYVFIAILTYQFALRIIAGRKGELAPFAVRTILMAGSVFLLSLVFLVSIYRVMPYFTRSSALTLDLIMQNPFTLKSFISFLFPYAVTAEYNYWNTDVSMSNGYFGILGLLLLIFSVFVKRNLKQLGFWAFGILFLAVSVGPELPVREWMYHYLPLMNVSRLPGSFRVLAIIGFVVVSGFTLQEVITYFNTYKKKLLLFSMGFMSIILLFTIYSSIGSGEGLFVKAFHNWVNVTWPSSMTISENIFVQGCIQLVIVGGFILAIYYSRSVVFFIYLIIGLQATDSILSAQLNLSATGIYPAKLSEAEYALKQQPEGFPFTNSKMMIDISDNRPGIKIPGLWANLNFFSKETPYNGYTSFYLNPYYNFSHAPYLSAALSNKLVFLSSKMESLQKVNSADLNDHLNLYFDDETLAELSTNQFVSAPGDTVFITAFTPNKITVRAITGGEQLITLMQNNFTGWKILINDKPVNLYSSNYTCITAVLPPGDNKVEFIYRPVAVLVAMGISGVAFFIITGYLIVTWLMGFRKTVPSKII
jgi:hypothetical protein